MDGDDGPGYKVVVAGSNSARGKSLTTEVYESSTESWKLIGTRPIQHHFQTNAVHCNGSLYSAGRNITVITYTSTAVEREGTFL